MGPDQPEAAERWKVIRPAVDGLACELGASNPRSSPATPIQQAVFNHVLPTRAQLLELGVRPWQADFLEPLISEALGFTTGE
ncbi:hypothetical protein [Tessaracoccus coleopterorum]|uniref:hypothetical protein n=1 Tax=Tessaracoccus coleopterorum TaxID=2714950 RepID=UPI001E35558C|nr:hypothetical protein [Tessaracoccus coleopterorum]